MKAIPLRKLKKSWRKLYLTHGDTVRSTAIGAAFIVFGIFAAKILLLKLI